MTNSEKTEDRAAPTSARNAAVELPQLSGHSLQPSGYQAAAPGDSAETGAKAHRRQPDTASGPR